MKQLNIDTEMTETKSTEMTKTIFYKHNVLDKYSISIKNMQNQDKFVGNSQSFDPPPPRFSTEFPPLNMCCNIHNFGITKRKVMASKLQVTPTKLQVTSTKLQVTPTKFTSLTADTNKFQLTNMLFITFLNVVLNARLTVACKWLYFMSSLGFSICEVTNTTGNNTQIYTRIQTRMYSYTIHPIKHGYLITARNSAISDDDNVTLAVRNAEVLL